MLDFLQPQTYNQLFCGLEKILQTAIDRVRCSDA